MAWTSNPSMIKHRPHRIKMVHWKAPNRLWSTSVAMSTVFGASTTAHLQGYALRQLPVDKPSAIRETLYLLALRRQPAQQEKVAAAQGTAEGEKKPMDGLLGGI